MKAMSRTDGITAQLKRVLWERFGSVTHPAEWDGHVYGGGKISQRFWEYFKVIEFLELDEGASLLDIGGSSPKTGISFFAGLLASCGVPVMVLDTTFDRTVPIPPNVTLIEGLADRQKLSEALRLFHPTHLSCISVLEHASLAQQKGVFEAVEDAFRGSHFVCTFEFHETTRFFDQQLTTSSLSDAVSVLTRYYLADIEAAPFHCVDAFSPSGIGLLGSEHRLQRLWFPLALGFKRV